MSGINSQIVTLLKPLLCDFDRPYHVSCLAEARPIVLNRQVSN
jgi:hypothetical protein